MGNANGAIKSQDVDDGNRVAQGASSDSSASKVTLRSRVATQVPLAATLALASCGGDSGSSSAPSPSPTTAPLSLDPKLVKASRFLSQATVGYSKSDIEAVANSSIEAWLDTQLAMPRPETFWGFLTANGYDAAENIYLTHGFDPMVWSQLIGSGDVLRQRIGLALLNLWVVGIDGLSIVWKQFAMAAYLDGIWNNAFENYRDLMEVAATSIPMGSFLTYLHGTKANSNTGSIPDENFARELMQLFTVGTVKLNMDGTEVIVNGESVPTYDQHDITQGARIWTGYTYKDSNFSTPAHARLPMAINEFHHETGETRFLNDKVRVAAGSGGAAARKTVLDALFNHENTPPFLAMHLIKNLVTSNPSPGYVQRVATTFVNNGQGVRGDMKAVIRSILTDKEARDDTVTSSKTFGKVREPILRLTHWARAFNVTSPTKLWPFGDLSSSTYNLAQSPGRSPSVFNWFRPGYVPPGMPASAQGMTAPELQLATEVSVIGYVNYMHSVIANGAGEAKADYSALRALAANSEKLLVELNLVLAAGQISTGTLSQMRSALDSIPAGTEAGLNDRIVAAILLVMASPEYLVLR